MHTLEKLQRGIAICRAFDAWDKFRHIDARRLLQPYQSDFVPWWRVLRCLSGESSGHGFEWVEDLLLNAERRASQERFDDAVGRVYRALELTAQVWLKASYGIQTGEINLELVPESARTDLERCREQDGRIKIGLLKAWDLTTALDNDPLGNQFRKMRKSLLAFLSVRNESLFALGDRPISSMDYQAHVPHVMEFLRNCVSVAIDARKLQRAVVLGQLPTSFLG